MAKKFPPIDYTSRDFNSIKNDLVEYAKRYYPTTFKDFNEASFGALMLDTVAYVGDILSYYLDHQANESFLSTAIEYDNVVKLARQSGYKFLSRAAASGVISAFILCPANANGIGPDTRYIPVLQAGSEFSSPSGATFMLNEAINFRDSGNEIVVARTDANNTPTYYVIRATGVVTSGKFAREEVELGAFEKFRTIELSTSDITEVVSVTDSEGHSYFEVDHLSQNTVYIPTINNGSDRNKVSSILLPIIVPRRFVVERERQTTFLQFGHGSDSEIKTQSIADPTDVLLDLHGRTHVTDISFDPTKLLSTDKFGVAPANTTLSIVIRKNTQSTTNVAAGMLTSVVVPRFKFKNRLQLDATKLAVVEGSLEISNEDPIVGDTTLPSPAELKARVSANFASQNRAVTPKDYQAIIYNLPAQFGAVKRCAILQDSDSSRRNINIYTISEDQDGKLANTPVTAKENLRTWVGQYKMINDTIDILDARIVNLGISFGIKVDDQADKHEVLQSCYEVLREELLFVVPQIGESFDIGIIYRILNRIPGVLDTIRVKVVNKSGGLYSDVSLDIKAYQSANAKTLFLPEDYIWEIRFPSRDIIGVLS